MLSPKRLRNLRAVSLLCPMTSVCQLPFRCLVSEQCTTGFIGQVAEELWEVANKTIRNLTKDEVIHDYKGNLIKRSEYNHIVSRAQLNASLPSVSYQ